MILILGKGTLANIIAELFDNCTLAGRPEYDFSTKSDCEKLVNQYNPSVVVNTIGVNKQHDSWDILTTNLVSTTYLTERFYNKMIDGIIINVSSASALWVSYPDINSEKLFYSFSKECLSQFGRHWNRKIIESTKPVRVCTLEIGSFPSNFNGYASGMNLDKIKNSVKSLIDNPLQHMTIVK